MRFLHFYEPDRNSKCFFNQLDDGLGGCSLLLAPHENQWVGDGICDDITNIIECDYDGGDCCMSDIDTQYCTKCSCHVMLCNSTMEWIGDGFCDDATNNQGKKRLAQKTCNHLF